MRKNANQKQLLDKKLSCGSERIIELKEPLKNQAVYPIKSVGKLSFNL